MLLSLIVYLYDRYVCLCVLFLFLILPPFHFVLLGLFFNFGNFCSRSHQAVCTNTPPSPQTTMWQSETQALLGRDIHTDTCATGALGNGKKIPVILPEFHRYCKDIRHRCSPLCVYSYVIIWSYVCLYMVNDRFHRGRQRRKNVFICILLR